MLATASLAVLLLTASGRAGAQSRPASPAFEARVQRAAALVRSRDFAAAAESLRSVLSVDPADRDARELLAFALESAGDLAGELAVRTALAGDFPDDARVQGDLGRVLERSGDAPGAIRAYRRARTLGDAAALPSLDAAIEHLHSSTAMEVAAPFCVISEPGASVTRAQAGAAIPLGAGLHAALLATHYLAHAGGRSSVFVADAVSLSLVRHSPAGGYWIAGPSLHLGPQPSGNRRVSAVGGMLAGSRSLGPHFQADWHAELETPWDEAAIAVLRGGRSTAAGVQLYAHAFTRRLLLQTGAQRRRLTIQRADGAADRPGALQSLWLGGADLVLWRDPRTALRGDVLDESLRSPTALASAITLAYRHYEATTSTSSEFRSLIDLAPRASVNELSCSSTLTSKRLGLGFELHGGIGRDQARGARLERAGGSLSWAPLPETRLSAGYEVADEAFASLFGRRSEGRLSLHVDL